MIESVAFKNFKVLRNATLPLGPLTLIVGPNGSGKSTAMDGLLMALGHQIGHAGQLLPADVTLDANINIGVEAKFGESGHHARAVVVWRGAANIRQGVEPSDQPSDGDADWNAFSNELRARLARVRSFALDARMIAQSVRLEPRAELAEDGRNLAIVLDRLRDEAPERFQALNDELAHWLPEFDQVLFETPSSGHRALMLRMRDGGHAIRAKNISQGTLLALAILCLAYVPDPPPVLCLEEPDRGLHPRLLRDVRDALYRLAYPQDFGESREPVQVIATTHSPYMLDLFRDHPQEIVIASKIGDEAKFERLVDHPKINEIIGDAPLGEVWYSGILGGVPTEK